MFAVDIRRVMAGLGAASAGAGAALTVAACGHQATLTHGHHFSIAEMEYRLRPNHIGVPSGALTVSVHNYGRLTHNFEVVLPTATTTVQTTPTGSNTVTSTVAARTPDLPPGASANLTVTLPAGRYGIASVVNNDQGEGMQGSITIASK